MQILAKTVKKETLFLKLENILCQRSPRIEAVCCCYSVAKSCPTLCDPMNLSMPTFPVLHYLLEFAQTPVHRVSSAVQPSRHLLPPSPPALSLSQHQGLSNESTICIRWPKYWSFSISPSNEYSGLISSQSEGLRISFSLFVSIPLPPSPKAGDKYGPRRMSI